MGTLKVNGDISATGSISASSFLGNASSASKWATARTIKIGKTGKSVDGSSNVSWTHYEIGVPYCYDTSPTGSPAYSHWGMLISREENKYGQSGTGDNYFIGVNSNSQLHIGHQLNGTSVITWTNILSEHNYSSYALPLSGGTMTGSPVIKFPASAGSIATSDPMAITYGRISAYGTLCINADSDGSTNEYLILTSGRGLSSSTADGLAIGYNTLTWQNNTVIHTGNIGSQSVNYANSAGNADRVYPINSNPNNSHPGYGLKVFYSWDQGQVGNDNGGYANGITIGSHPGDQAYGFQIVQNMWNDRTYTRRYNQGWQSWKTLAWIDDLAAYLPLSGGTMSGHLVATSGITWNHTYWQPNGNITCTPTGNGQEWSFDVGASGYTGCYWHVWSSKNGCSMLRCDADNNAVGIPNGPLYLGSSCYGPNLPGASYVGQIFFKT